jgi:hypothetical protein
MQFARTPEQTTADEMTERWLRAWRERDHTPLPAPERTHRPQPRPEVVPQVATRLEPPLDGGWIRSRLTAGEVHDLRQAGVPVMDDWRALDLTSGLYNERGVVVMDVRS